MAACPSCFASLRDDDTTCPRCGREVADAGAGADRPTITPWVAPERPPAAPVATPPAPALDPEPTSEPGPDPAPAPAPDPIVVAAPAPTLGAPWRPPGPAAPAPSWSPPPGPAAGPPAVGPPPAGWAPPNLGWPATGTGPPPAAIQPGREPDPARSNAIVLVITSAAVALVIIGLALLATSGNGPEVVVPRPTAVHQPAIPEPEAERGR